MKIKDSISRILLRQKTFYINSVGFITLVGIIFVLLIITSVMPFMEGGFSHIFQGLLIIPLIILLFLIFNSRDFKNKNHFVTVLISFITVGVYVFLYRYITHIEFVFTLAIISISALFGLRQGLISAFLLIPGYLLTVTISDTKLIGLAHYLYLAILLLQH